MKKIRDSILYAIKLKASYLLKLNYLIVYKNCLKKKVFKIIYWLFGILKNLLVVFRKTTL